MDITKLKNIYTILDEIGFDEKAERVKLTIERGLDPKQAIFSIIQPFYENILDQILNEE